MRRTVPERRARVVAEAHLEIVRRNQHVREAQPLRGRRRRFRPHHEGSSVEILRRQRVREVSVEVEEV